MSKFSSFAAFAASELKVSRERFATGAVTEAKGRNTQFVACLVACGVSLVTYGQRGNKPTSVEQYAGTTGKEIASFLCEGTSVNVGTTEQYLSNAMQIVAQGGKHFDQKVSDAARRGDAVFLEGWIADKGGISGLRASWKGKGKKGGNDNPTRLERIASLITKEAKERNKSAVSVIASIVRTLDKGQKAELVALLTKGKGK